MKLYKNGVVFAEGSPSELAEFHGIETRSKQARQVIDTPTYPTSPAIAARKYGKRHPKNYVGWSKKDDEYLIKNAVYGRGRGGWSKKTERQNRAVAKYLGRTRSSIKSRLVTLRKKGIIQTPKTGNEVPI